jgi:hypothetical protein
VGHNRCVSPVPAAEYRRRLASHRDAHERWTRLHARMASARLAAFVAAIVVLGAAYSDAVSYWALLVPLVLFVALVYRHDRVLRRLDDAARAMAFYERGLARIEDRWSGTGEPGERFRDDHHLYANDLDLFGSGSLFELLSIARTRAGEEALADWLKTPAAPDEIAARQLAVSELTPALDLREMLGRIGAEVRAGVHSEALLGWAEAPEILSPRWLRWIARLFTAAIPLSIAVSYAMGDLRPFFGFLLPNLNPALALVAAQSLFTWPQLRRLEHVLHAAAGAARDLDILAHLLQRLEQESFQAPRLVQLREQLKTEGTEASRAIRVLHRLVDLHEWQHNLVFLVLSMPLLVGTHLAWAIEGWRRHHGAHIRRWLAAAGDFEALASLSAYRYEHPDDPFPRIVTSGHSTAGDAVFDGTSLGHPLLPDARMIRNDVHLGGETRLLVISGSNMSGKSTLLRTVGINAVLALAGAPVRAVALTLSPLALGATLRIQDSLQEGRSRFFAEITRIREIVDVAGDLPVGAQRTKESRAPLLFLLDELFHGTNSHDRLVGASGVLRSLLDRGAIGLITTHDLALTAIAEDLAPRALNVHFEDWFEQGEMRFDYRMKPGRVTRSNALALMRAVGLDVAAPEGGDR